MLIPTAAHPLAEPAIADEVERELAAAGLTVERLDLDEATPSQARAVLKSADVIAVSGGDPFHVLVAARRSGFERAARDALAAGAVYVGYGAGAILAGPTLEPLRCTSPFLPPPGLDLTGLRLADVLVLPHHDRPGRAERHAAAEGCVRAPAQARAASRRRAGDPGRLADRDPPPRIGLRPRLRRSRLSGRRARSIRVDAA